MRVLICGSRDWDDRGAILERLKLLRGKVTIIQGECRGADSIARDAALSLGLDVEGYYANWQKHGRNAGPIRNRKMLDRKPDLVIAFHNDLESSKGTKDTVREAKRRGIHVEV